MKRRLSSLTSKPGFTLIELLLVIGIIAILAAVVIIAINPSKQLADARNAQRRSDVNTILNAVYQYAIDNNGNLPSGIPQNTPIEICATSSTTNCTTAGLDLDVLTGSYVVRLPKDPRLATTATGTNYWIYQSTSGRVTVSASGAELDVTISVTR